MKNRLLKTTAIILLICVSISIFISCGNDEATKITEDFIRSKLSNSDGELDGTLTIIKGSSEKVLAFNYVVSDINAEDLMNKNFAKKAIEKLMSNPGKVTYGELKVCNAFGATMGVISIFYGDETFDSNSYTDEILSIICDGNTKTYNNWTISASVNQTSDSITINATHN